MIVGLQEELRFLERHYAKDGNQILVVYGTRGVGKNSLIREFVKGKDCTSYVARACSDREQRFQWSQELKEVGMEVSDYPEYSELFERILPESVDKKILILEEFQYLIKGEGHFFEKLISFLENRKVSRPVLVVLLSSATGWVENSMVSKIGGLAIYINGFLKVKERSFSEMHRLFPEYSMQDCILNYAVLGGIPGLWKSFDKELSVKENIIQNILIKESRLHEEMSVYMAEELREPAVYNTILATIASGITKLNDIYRHTGFPRAKISVYLKNLMELDFIEKIYAGVYRISNPYIKFYFRFIFPNKTLLTKKNAEEFYGVKIEPFLEEYSEEAYSAVCRQMFAEDLPEGFEVSEWVGKDYKIAIVGVDENCRRLVAACSYSRMMTAEDCKQLLTSARKAKIEVDRVILFSEKGFAEELKLAENEEKVELRSLCD